MLTEKEYRICKKTALQEQCLCRAAYIMGIIYTDIQALSRKRSGTNVVRMRCDCPYADGGENCKHMAAVVYALEETHGAEEARKLAAYWHEYHKSRPAMKDELCKAGYPQE